MPRAKNAKAQGELVRVRPEIAKLLQGTRELLKSDPRYVWASLSTTAVAQMCLIRGMDQIRQLLSNKEWHPFLVEGPALAPVRCESPDRAKKTSTKLVKWIEENRKTKAGLARELGVSYTTIHRWCAGETRPNAAGLASIERLTNGVIRAEDFV